ncbi:hypothetical protein LG047_15100 [Methylocystis sp. WRRC1]|uniref:hypothetical protein n=1 Tax=Methylocystis sp. WRRC1 TaxID=1732014 RepID=UPI001D1513BE|nr:hypothetical protein [Methylocystis sp. WRRC1]MCC3246627.1 hypothetical protein [Methylocystis sp. WRRC1]
MFTFSRRPADDPAEEAARLLLRVGVFLLFVISLVAPILARQTVYILLPIGAALLLISASLSEDARAGRSLRAILLSPPMLAAMLLVLWTGLSLLWTPFSGPGERFGKAVATLGLVAVATGFLPLRTKTSNLNLLPIGAAIAAVALVAITLLLKPQYSIEDILDVGPLARAGLGLALLVWPAMGALAVRGRWYSAAALGVGTILACYLSKAPNALPALVGGAVVFAAAFGRARQMSMALAALMAAIILLAPLAAFSTHLVWPESPPAFFKHLAFWGHMIASDGPRTLIGHGFGAATWGVLGGYLTPATPRSLIFQIWFDLGVLGAAALALVAVRASLAVGGTRPALAPFLLGGLGAGFVICLLGPAAEQLWWLTLAGLDAIAFALVTRGQFRKRRPRLPAGWGAPAQEGA